MAKAPAQSPDPLQTEQDIRKAIRRFERRLSDLAAFEPSSVTARNDPKIDVLEAAISEALHETYVENGAAYRRYVQAATLDTAGINMNGTPHHKVIEGLVHGKERSIALLQQAIRALQEKLDMIFPLHRLVRRGHRYKITTPRCDRTVRYLQMPLRRVKSP